MPKIEESDILQLIAPYVEVIKKAKKETPVFSECHSVAVKQAHQIRVHADGLFPANLITRRAPSETPDEFGYRAEAWQPVTMGPWDKIVNSTNPVFSGVGVTIDDDHSVGGVDDDYLNKAAKDGGYPYEGAFMGFCRTVLKRMKVQEPMACAYVTRFPELIESDGDFIRPYVEILTTDRVLSFVEGQLLLGWLKEKSMVKKGRLQAAEGLVFIVVTDTDIFKVKQIGNLIDYTFEVVPVIEHNLERLPAYRLKGDPAMCGAMPFYRSMFFNAVPLLNKVAFEASTLDISVARSGFPIRAYYEQRCDDCSGEGKQGDETCDTCNGSGMTIGFGPMRDYKHTPPSSLTEPDQKLPFPGVAYVSPETAILDFLEQRGQRMIEQAGNAVNIDLTRRTTAETATKVRGDLEQHHSDLEGFAQSIYDLIECLGQDVEDMRFYLRSDINPQVSVNRRAEFTVQSTEDMAGELSGMLPDFLKANILENFVGTRYASNEVVKRMAEVARYVDPLLFSDGMDAAQKVARLDPRVVAIHDNFVPLLNQLIAEDADFLDRSLEEIRTALLAIAPVNTTGTPEDILSGILG